MSASRFSLRLFARPLHRALHLLERIAGLGFLEDLTELLQALDGVADALSDRARRVEALLFGAETRFVLVCRALSGSEASTQEVLADMAGLGAPLVALVVNRMQPWPIADPPTQLLERCRGDDLAGDLGTLTAALGATRDDPNAPGPGADVAEAVLDYARVCRSEQERCLHLASEARAHGLGFTRIRELSEPLDAMQGLLGIAAELVAHPAPGAGC